MRVKDGRARRLALAAVAAGILLLASIGFAVAGGMSRSAHRIPTIVTDRPLEAPTDATDLTLAAADVVEPAAIIETVTVGANTPAAAAASSGSSSKTSRPAASAKPHSSNKATARTSDDSDHDDDHEVVRPTIRDEDSDDHDDSGEDRSDD